MEIVEVKPGDALFRPLFDFYAGFFPPVERNTYESLLSYYGKADGVYRYESFACLEGGEVAGGCYANFFSDIGTCVIEFLFIGERFRGRGFARRTV